MKIALFAAALALASVLTAPAFAQESVQLEVAPRIVAAAQKDARELLQPSVPISTYDAIEIAPMSFSNPIKADPRKLAKAQEFEARFGLHLRDTLKAWNAKSGAEAAPSTKKLIIKPGVQSLQIVSGGARFFAGALSGDSKITVTMQFVDAASGAIVASPTIAKSSSGFAGAWSFGSTDNNLMSYAAETANQYLALYLNPDEATPAPEPQPVSTEAPAPAQAAPTPAQ